MSEQMQIMPTTAEQPLHKPGVLSSRDCLPAVITELNPTAGLLPATGTAG
jgi:hypothetical protein